MDADKDATYKFTKEEVDEMRAAYRRMERKLDLILSILSPLKNSVKYFVSLVQAEEKNTAK